MERIKISSFICALLLFSLPSIAGAQGRLIVEEKNQPKVRGIQFEVKKDSAALAKEKKEIPIFAGVAVSTDIVGASMAGFGKYGSYEAACRVSIKDRYFPIVEVGIGTSNHTDKSTDNYFKTHSPFFRLGCDYNFTKDRLAFGRLMVGARYGFSSFKYDVGGPALNDATWGETLPFHFSGIKARAHWCEVVFGLDARIWKFIRFGWNLRWKFIFNEKRNEIGKAWYIPGYGENESSRFGGQFNIIFEI